MGSGSEKNSFGSTTLVDTGNKMMLEHTLTKVWRASFSTALLAASAGPAAAFFNFSSSAAAAFSAAAFSAAAFAAANFARSLSAA
jgi:hypothetical protein